MYTFHTTHHYSNLIKEYGYHLWRTANQTSSEHHIEISSSREVSGKSRLLFGLVPGVRYSIPYKLYRLEIEIAESVEFKGSGGGLAKWMDIYVHIGADTIQRAEEILNEFVNDGLEQSRQTDQKRISIYSYDPNHGWKYLSELPKRSLDTVYLDPAEKRKIQEDINAFVQDEQEYHELGIPYKRCYMFQGTPGSGKTSLIFALASMLRRDIGIFHFSSEINDTLFISAISQLPPDRILVLEDFDALFVNRDPLNQNHVSLSALLNVLDGVCRKDRMLTFITANYISQIDPALIRPGRVDYIMKFTHATTKQIRQMYDRFRQHLDQPRRDKEFAGFCQIVKGKSVNMSLIQKFLFEHRKAESLLEYDEELYTLISTNEEKNILAII